VPPPLRCPRCRTPVLLPERADEPIRCPRCRCEVAPTNASVTASPPSLAKRFPEPDPELPPGILRCPGCGTAIPEQCRVCPSCDGVLDGDAKETWPERLWDSLSGEFPQADHRLWAAGILGAVYLSVLISAGVGYLVALAAPDFGPAVGYIVFVFLLACFAGLAVYPLEHQPNNFSHLSQKTRRGIFLVLVFAGVVCSILLLAVAALVVLFFAAYAATRGRF
jgi:hypothetical protein